MCPSFLYAQFSGSGSGTENDPYLILNPTHVNQIRNFNGTLMNKHHNMEERDLLKEMFECYFRYRKMNSELPEERLIDATSGAQSGADYPKVVRSDLLSSIILHTCNNRTG